MTTGIGFGVGYDPRVGHQQTRNVRPVLVDLGLHRRRHHGFRNIGPPAAECFDVTANVRSVVAGNNVAPPAPQPAGQGLEASGLVEASLAVEEDDLDGVDQLGLEQGRDDQAVEVLAAACDVIERGAFGDARLDDIDLVVDGAVDAQLGGDPLEPLADHADGLGEVQALLGQFVADDQ